MRILDLGCGPGRDLPTLPRPGHEAVGLDGAARFVAMARAAPVARCCTRTSSPSTSPQRVRWRVRQRVVFHVPAQELPRVLESSRPRSVRAASSSLEPARGETEGWNRRRYGASDARPGGAGDGGGLHRAGALLPSARAAARGSSRGSRGVAQGLSHGVRRSSPDVARLLDILATRRPGASKRTLRQMLAHERITVDGRTVIRADTEVSGRRSRCARDQDGGALGA